MIQLGEKKILIKQGDITQETTDAIVNPANGQLSHGGGAAGAIVRQGGLEIQRQSDEIIRKSGFLPTGKAVITDSGKLPCKYVIHTVGPRRGEGQEPEKLRKAVWSALTLAELYNLNSLSLPSVSSGIFGFPKDKCAEILLETAVEFLQQPDVSLQTVIMCNQDQRTCSIFLEKAKKYQ